MKVADALFRLLLRLYPRSFRERYAGEMGSTWRARRARAWASGRLAVLRFDARELTGLLAGAMRARRNTISTSSANSSEPIMETLLRDAGLALRSARRNPFFTAAVIGLTGLGVGAAAAIFSAVDAALFRPLPFGDPERLVMVWEENAQRDWYQQTAAPANFLDWRERVAAFEDATAYASFMSGLTLTGAGQAERIAAQMVGGNFFEALRERPAHGRTFREEETWSDAPPVVVLSDGFWERRFGRDPGVIGGTLELNDRRYEVIGVMPRGFTFPASDLDVWVPFDWDATAVTAASFRRAHWLRVIARLAPGATAAQAETQLKTVAAQLEREHPQLNAGMGAGLTPLQEFLVGDSRTSLLLLFGTTGLLLLLTCANVANLLLVRLAGRRREVAVRAAMGAARGRIARQLLTESVLLAVLGGVLGMAIAAAAVGAISSLAPPDLAGFEGIAVDARVLAFALAVAVATGIAFGAGPAWRNARVPTSEALREGVRTGGAAPGRSRAQALLVVAEVALALVIVSGAGLLVRSYLVLRTVDPGFEIDSRLSARIGLPSTTYETLEAQVTFLEAVTERLEALPGVEDVTATNRLPLTGTSYTTAWTVQGGSDGYEVVNRMVDHDYFAVMGVPLLAGRSFTAEDRLDGEPVAILNQSFAREAFGSDDPVGRLITVNRDPGPDAVWRRVVGVVGEERQAELGLPARIELFIPMRQNPSSNPTLVVHTRVEPTAVTAAVRNELQRLDARVPLYDVRTLEDIHAAALSRDRFLLLLLAGFASVAFLLAVGGVYGVTAHAARSRTQEIGIRVALGARGRDVLWLVVRRTALLVAAGTTLGWLGAFAGSRLMRDVLHGVAATDPVTFTIVPVVLATAALLACYVPARRAARTDPAHALRAE